mmetsp:Transcript_25964/g.32329  ORF Transcript_25964/g.32329 Transcript_25964/m.32329 type:complete len:204 (+) Transcript_25964:48-659(+)
MEENSQLLPAMQLVSRAGISLDLLEVRIDVVLEADGDALVVLSAPLASRAVIHHDFAHVVRRVRHLVVFERHPVKLAHVLLNLVLSQVLRAAEAGLITFQGHIRSRKNHFVADEVLLLTRFLKATRDCRLDALWAHILLKIEPLLVVAVQLVQVLLIRLRRGFKVAIVLGVQVANLGGVPHLEVDLIWVETEPFHCLQAFPRL